MTDRKTVKHVLREAMKRLSPEERASLRVGSIPTLGGGFLIDADAPMHEKMKFVDFVHKKVFH